MYSILPATLLETIILEEPAASVVFDGIIAGVASLSPGAQHLLLTSSARNANAGAGNICHMTVNADTGATNYGYQYGTVASVTVADSNDSTYPAMRPTEMEGPDASYAFGECFLPWAFTTTKQKTAQTLATRPGERIMHGMSFHHADTDAIDVLTITNFTAGQNIDTGSIFRLWAIDEDALLDTETLALPGVITFDPAPAARHLVAITSLRSNEAGTNGSRAAHIINGTTDPTDYFSQRWNVESGDTVVAEDNLRRIAYITSDLNTASAFGSSCMIYPFTSLSDREIIAWDHAVGLDTTYTPSMVEVLRTGETGPLDSIAFDIDISAGGTLLQAGSTIALYDTGEPFNSVTLDAPAPSISFFLPDTEGSVTFVISARSEEAALDDDLFILCNDVILSDEYQSQFVTADGTSINSSAAASGAPNASRVAVIAAEDTASGVFTGGTITILEYARNDRHKSMMFMGGGADANLNHHSMTLHGVKWLDNSPITKITLSTLGADFAAGTRVDMFLSIPPVVPSNALAHWKMNSLIPITDPPGLPDGDYVYVNDETANDYDIYVPVGEASLVGGRFNFAVSVGGDLQTGEGLQTANSELISILNNGDWTYAGWVKLSDESTTEDVTLVDGGGWNLTTSADGTSFFVAGTVEDTEFGEVSTTEFNHIALVYDSDASDLKIYFNGVLAATDTYSNTWSLIKFGGNDTDAHNPIVDETYLYARQLSTEEIEDLFAAAIIGSRRRKSNSIRMGVGMGM